MALLSPGVEVTEIDASQIVPTVSNAVGVFAGLFHKGPVGQYLLISSQKDLIRYYGYPSNQNYNDWEQANSFLLYGNNLLISRACNINGNGIETNLVIKSIDNLEVIVEGKVDLKTKDKIIFADENKNLIKEPYQITAIDGQILTLDKKPNFSIDETDRKIYSFYQSLNAQGNAYKPTGKSTPRVDENGKEIKIKVKGVLQTEMTNKVQDIPETWNPISIGNASLYQLQEPSIYVEEDAVLKFIARDIGTADKIEIAIANPDDFNKGKSVFYGIKLDDLFEYYPIKSDTKGSKDEFGIIVRVNNEIQETFTVSFDRNMLDKNNRTEFVEDVINKNSNYVYCKVNGKQTEVDSYLEQNVIKLSGGFESDIQNDDLEDAYLVWENKEEVDIDVVIGNERDGGFAAKKLTEKRKDCMTFVGVPYESIVGKTSAQALHNIINLRKYGALNWNSMFCAAFANYVYVYNKFLDRNVWINVAGHCAGIRCETNSNQNSWWASAGLNRGKLKGVLKIAFNPNVSARDELYKNSLNPIVSFAGQGIVIWGQKTLLNKDSSFSRINTRGLFNILERSLEKMARFQIMEFNDTFTRNSIISMISPYLSTVKAGRGIVDYLIVCDESNNTPDVISRNYLVIDVFIKPAYVVEFIHLRFTNAGTRSFSEITNV